MKSLDWMSLHLDLLNVIFGAISAVAFLFSVYQYVVSRKNENVENAKIREQQERLRGVKYVAVTAIEAANQVVQRSKDGTVTLDELRTLGRLARGNIEIILRQLEIEDEKLSQWEYGRMMQSKVMDATPAAKAQVVDRNEMAPP